MRTYYCVTSTVDDRGNVISNITERLDAETKPKDTYTSTNRMDIYCDWFPTPEDALAHMEAMRE